MSCFTKMSTVTANKELDLTKHVNYTAGMILGVDDFTQEFAYLAGRDRWLAREAIGYGTVSGLRVQPEKGDEKGPRVMVMPGVAISPRGQLICVPSEQCAYLNQWLAAAKPEDLLKWIRTESGSPPLASPPVGDGELTLYVVLCFRDCLTDNVPIPGEPCRSEEELMADSRVKDDFSLELRFEPPKQLEEEAVRKYADFLKQIEISDAAESTPIDEFLDAIRAAFSSASPPPSPPIVSPPAGLHIHPEDVSEYIRLAFRLWVTELRSALSDKATGCAVEMTGGKKLEDCILLAELRVALESVSPGWKVSDTEDVQINEENRPFLLHLRMLQEWMINEPNDHGALTGLLDDDHPQYLLIDGSRAMAGHLNLDDYRIINLAEGRIAGDAVPFQQAIKVGDRACGDLTGTYPRPTIAALQGNTVTADSPREGQILIFRGKTWVTENPITDHGELTGLGDDDHRQYLPLTGSRQMTGNLRLGSNRITGVAAGAANGEAVIFEQAVKHTDNAGGDLSEKFNKLLITHLQGKPVNARDPQTNDVLFWDGAAWVPHPLQEPTSETKPFTILPLATITRGGTVPRLGTIYEIWFNIDSPQNLVQVVSEREKTLEGIFVEGETNGSNFLTALPSRTSPTNIRNVFQLILEKEMPYMRFNFILDEIMVKIEGAGTMSLAEYARERSIQFRGSKDKTATIFVRATEQRIVENLG